MIIIIICYNVVIIFAKTLYVWFYLPLATPKCCCFQGLAPPVLDIWLMIWGWLTIYYISDLSDLCSPGCLQPQKEIVNIFYLCNIYQIELKSQIITLLLSPKIYFKYL